MYIQITFTLDIFIMYDVGFYGLDFLILAIHRNLFWYIYNPFDILQLLDTVSGIISSYYFCQTFAL